MQLNKCNKKVHGQMVAATCGPPAYLQILHTFTSTWLQQVLSECALT